MKRVETGAASRWVALAIAWAFVSAPLAAIALGALGERPRFPGLLPRGGAFRPWDSLLHPASGIPEAAATSLALAAAVTLAALALALPAAWTLAGPIPFGRARTRTRARARSLALAALLTPVAAPAFAIGFGLRAAFARVGFDTGLAGVALGQLVPTLPYAVFILVHAFRRLDPNWAEQARTLGHGPAGIAWHVIVPLIRPSIGVAAAVAFIVAWSDYMIVLLLGGGRIVTLPMHTFALALGGARAVAAAVAVLYIVPPLIALLAINRLAGPGERRA